MSEVVQCAFVSDAVGNINVYDISNGTLLMVYKTGVVSQKCMSLLKNDYILAAEKGPLIHIWPLNSREKLQSLRMVCPGVVSCLAVSPDNCYIAASTGEKLLIWQVCNGKLLSTTNRHYQQIIVIKWCEDGSHVVTGGADGLVCVWRFSSLVTGRSVDSHSSGKFAISEEVEPVYTFSDHAVKITDIHVGSGGCRARIFTSSADKTCKVYCLSTGDLLLSIVFEDRLTAITVDFIEVNAFIGTGNGNIHSFCLLDPPRTRDCHYKNTGKNSSFLGHTKHITCLSCTIDSAFLVSSSSDNTVKIWHITSRQCLRTIEAKGTVINVLLKMLPRHVFSQDYKSNMVVKSFQKRYDNTQVDELNIITAESLFESDSDDETKIDASSSKKSVQKLTEELERMKLANKQIYDFALEKILKSLNNQEQEVEGSFENLNLPDQIVDMGEQILDKTVMMRKAALTKKRRDKLNKKRGKNVKNPKKPKIKHRTK